MTKYKYTDGFVRALPKTDLHLHLDGSLRLSTMIELAKTHEIELPSYTEEGMRELVFKDQYKNLGEYLHGFAFTCAVLQTSEALERAAFELAEDCFNEGTRYIEVRFAPQLHIHTRMNMAEVLVAVTRGLQSAEKQFNARKEIAAGAEPPFRAGIIVCAMRQFTENFSIYYQDYIRMHRYRKQRDVIKMASIDLATAAVRIRNEFGLPIVGFDLAGQEDGYPAGVHEEAYDFVHRNFMQKTVHAGEAFGPESIFQAITELNADRIGHGYHLFSTERITDPNITDPEKYVADLTQYIANRRTTIEVCLTSNLQTMPELVDIKQHRYRDMLKHRLSTTLCTDNRLISNTTIIKEILLATNNFVISPRKLKDQIIYGFKRSFFPGSYLEKRAYVRQIIDYYDIIERQFGIS